MSFDAPSPAVFDLRGVLLRGGAFLFGRQLGSIFLSLIGILVVTRVIGPEHYGAYTSALGITQYLQTLCSAGIAVFLIRHANDVSERQYRVASTFLAVISLFLVTCIELGAGVIGQWVQGPEFTSLLRALAPTLVLSSLTAVAVARIDRALDFRQAAIIELSGQIIYYIVAVPLALLGYGAWSLVSAWIVQQVFSCILVHFATRYALSFVWDNAIIFRILSYSLQFSAATWTWQLRSLVNPLIVGHFLGAEAVAYVGLTVRLMELLAVAKTVVWRLSIAAFGRLQTQPEKLLRGINEAMLLQTLVIGPLLLGFSWFGGTILLKIAGDRWSPVIDLFPYIAVAYLTNAQFNMHASALAVLNRNAQVTLFGLLNLILFASACAVAVPRFGLIGYGWAEIIALPSYIALHVAVTRAIGTPNYRLSFLWWSGIGLGLFWRELGWWTISIPFIVLLVPSSIRQVLSFVSTARQSQQAPTRSEVPDLR
jgi:O-antigen/teichoic acid export membrane protein